MRVKHSSLILLLVLSFVLLPCVARAQSTQTDPEGITWGDFKVQQSMEFGFRFSDDWQKGNPRLFDNYVNLHEGPRLIENTLSMRSLSQTAPLFDNLYVNTFGFGGDPNNVARVKISKNKWYNFSGSFRRDQNFFDYPQFGNPLNPASTLANTTTLFTIPKSSLSPGNQFYAIPQFQDSAHPFEVRRRMYDFDLTLLPQSIVSVRLGYSRLNNTGPSFSSFHEGTDFLLGGGYDNTNISDNSYRIGADFKLLPKTTISFDQTFDYFKNDSKYDLSGGMNNNLVFNVFNPAGSPVAMNFGLPYYGALNNPCANFIVSTTGLANASCSGLYPVNPISGLPGYYRYQRTRTDLKSEQFSFVSHAIKKVDLTGRYIYSWGDMESPFTEDFYGGVSRTQERRWGQTGTASSNFINNSAEISATIHLTDKLRVLETFRFYAWRTPVLFTTNEWSYAPALISGTGRFTTSGSSIACLPGTTVAPGFSCTFLLDPVVGLGVTPAQALLAPQSSFGAHNSSTGADQALVTSGGFLGQNAKWNTVSVEYDFLKSFGARLGYRYGIRRDADKEGFETGTEYYYPNPVGIGTITATGPSAYVGVGAARRGDCTAAALAAGTATQAANGVCTVTLADDLSEPDVFDVAEHTGLFGLWFRPTHSLRMNGEVEISSFDHAVTRVSPTHQQHYRFRTTWQPSSKAVISATYNGIESSNPGSVVPPLPASAVIGTTSYPFAQGYQPSTLDINYKGHSRSFGVSTSFTPTPKVSFDIAYNYNQFAQSNLVCPVYASTTAVVTGLASSVWPNQQVCPLFADQVSSADGSMQAIGGKATAPAVNPNEGKILPGENLANGTFESNNHFVSFFVTYRPVKRVMAQIGYNWSNNNGNMLVLSPWLGVGTPTANPSALTSYLGLPNTYGAPGSLDSNYHMPSIAISYEFVKNWTAKAQWNYWAYGENTVSTGTGLSNNFHTNTGLVTLRYAF